MGSRRAGYALLVLLGVAALWPTLAFGTSADAGVAAYPSSQTIPPSGPLPEGGAEAVTLNAAIGEREGAWIVVTGARTVSATIDASRLGSLKASLRFAHFVRFGARAVPDALLPWDGSGRAVERPNQPLYLQVEIPDGTAPGAYRALVERRRRRPDDGPCPSRSSVFPSACRRRTQPTGTC